MQSKMRSKTFQSFNFENLNLLREKKDTTFSTDHRTHTKMHIFLNRQAHSQMQNAQCMYFLFPFLMWMDTKRKWLYNFDFDLKRK